MNCCGWLQHIRHNFRCSELRLLKCLHIRYEILVWKLDSFHLFIHLSDPYYLLWYSKSYFLSRLEIIFRCLFRTLSTFTLKLSLEISAGRSFIIANKIGRNRSQNRTPWREIVNGNIQYHRISQIMLSLKTLIIMFMIEFVDTTSLP
jgi:hypothetical protein